MTVNLTKIRVGAPDLMLLDAMTTTPVDLGASTGGATLTYNPTYYAPDIDQSTLPVYVARTKEEISFKANVPQVSALLLVAAWSLPTSNKVTTASGTMSTAATCTVTPTGGSATAYDYIVVPFNYNGDHFPAAIGSTAAGVATLSATAYNTIAWATIPAGATGVKIIRLVGGSSQGLVATLQSYNVPGSWVDTGTAATTYTPAGGYASQGSTTFTAATAVDSTATFSVGQWASAVVIAGASIGTTTGATNGTTLGGITWTGGTPSSATPFYVCPASVATPNTDTVSFGGSVYVPGHTLDWAVPKNDNTQNHWLGHLYNVYSSKSIALDYSKTKETGLNTLELTALASLTQTAGSQAGYVTEQR